MSLVILGYAVYQLDVCTCHEYRHQDQAAQFCSLCPRPTLWNSLSSALCDNISLSVNHVLAAAQNLSCGTVMNSIRHHCGVL